MGLISQNHYNQDTALKIKIQHPDTKINIGKSPIKQNKGNLLHLQFSTEGGFY